MPAPHRGAAASQSEVLAEPADMPPPRAQKPTGSAGAAVEGPRRVLAGFVYTFQEDSYGRHWVLHEGENLVGRADTNVKCDVPIAHGTTSTRHAAIRCADGQVTIQDMKSTNGTFVNGRRLEPNVATSVQDGDKLRFGAYTVHIMMAAHRG